MTSKDACEDSSGVESEPDSDPLNALRTLANDLVGSSRSANTERAYRSAWGGFERWGTAHRLSTLPASGETVALYLASLVARGRGTGTVQCSLVAICQGHLDAGYPSPRNDPRVRRLVKGVRRRLGGEQFAKAPLTPEHVGAMLGTLGTDLRALRDRAILALGFATGMRRSELVGLAVSDFHRTEAGMVVTIQRSKRNATARRVSIKLGVETACPVLAVRRWLEVSGLSSGPAFRKVTRAGLLGRSALQDRAVARLVKRVASAVGLDPKGVSGHSLRSGFATASARAGVSAGQIQRTLGHASAGMTLRYLKDSDAGELDPFHSASPR